MDIKVAKLKGGYFYLSREGDQEGDCGPMLLSLKPISLDKKGKNGEVHVGCHIQCGSLTERSFQWQDFWITTPVVKILEVHDKEIRFQTRNSIYKLTAQG